MGEANLPADYSASPLARLWSFVFSGDFLPPDSTGDTDSDSNDTASQLSNGVTTNGTSPPGDGGDHKPPRQARTQTLNSNSSATSAGLGDTVSRAAALGEGSGYEDPLGLNERTRTGLPGLQSSLLTMKLADFETSPTTSTSTMGTTGNNASAATTSGHTVAPLATRTRAALSERSASGSEGGVPTTPVRLNFEEQLVENPNKLPRGCRPISAVVLSYWDNICGPKIEKTWGHQRGGTDLFLFVTKHSLNGEMFRQTINELESKFYVLGDHGVAVSSFIFAGYCTPMTENKYTLCLIIPLEHVSLYLSYYPIVLNRIPSLIDKLIALQKRPDRPRPISYSSLTRTPILASGQFDPTENFSQMIVKFAADLHMAHKLSLPEDIDLQDTIFGSLHENLVSQALLKVILTSFFQTHGCIVIIGATPQIVNTVILSMALFLSPNERKRCTLYSRDYRTFQPGFFIQGFVPHDQLLFELSHQNLLEAPYPNTIVDLSAHTVQQVCSHHTFTKLRKIKVEPQSHIPQKAPEGLDPRLLDAILTNVTMPVSFISSCVNEILALPHVLRVPHITHINLLLRKKAIALIQYIHCTLATLRSSGLQAVSLPQPVLRKLISDLSLGEVGFFYVVLATAEKLQPGIYSQALGDTISMEDKFAEMIESF